MLQDWYTGRKLSAANLQEAVDAVRNLDARLNAVGSRVEELSLRERTIPPFPIRLMAEPAAGEYEWRMEYRSTGGAWEAQPGGMTHEASSTGKRAKGFGGEEGLEVGSADGVVVPCFPVVTAGGEVAFMFAVGGSSVIPAKITGSSGTAHAWSETIWNSMGAAIVKTGGRSGTTTEDSAFERNGAEEIPDDTLVLIRPEKVDGGGVRYVFDQPVLSVAVEVVSNYGVNGASNLLWKKTRELTVQKVGDESGETTVHTGTVCPAE